MRIIERPPVFEVQGLDHGFGHTNPKRKRGNRRNSLPRRTSLALFEVARCVFSREAEMVTRRVSEERIGRNLMPR